MTSVLLDTVGLLALWDRNDQWHEGAVDAFDQLRLSSPLLVVTDLILYEVANASARRPYRHRVVPLRNEFDADRRLISPTPTDLDAAWSAYEHGSPGDAGIVDQVSFQVMRRLGIEHVFSNDRHFRNAGFITLF